MDEVLKTFVGDLSREVADKQQALAERTFTDMYQVGIMQGEIRGLQEALRILTSVIEEADR